MGQILKGVGGRKYVFVAILYQKRNKRFRCVQQRNWVCCTRAIKNYVLYWVCCTVGIKDYFIFWVSCTDYFIFWVCCTIFHFRGLLHIRNKRLFHLLDLLHRGNKSLCCGHQRNWICCTDYFILCICCTDYFIFCICCTVRIKAYVVDNRGTRVTARLVWNCTSGQCQSHANDNGCLLVLVCLHFFLEQIQLDVFWAIIVLKVATVCFTKCYFVSEGHLMQLR